MSAIRIAYTALVYALLPRAFVHLLWRARRQPAYREHIAERFGFFRRARAERRVIWIHAVSVGETRAIEPLVCELLARFPGERILLTHMTPTGRETGEVVFGNTIERAYLPYDFPAAIARFLEHFRPRVGVLVETEVWPNVIHACRSRGIPLYLVNARMSEKSFNGYRRFARLAREAFGGFTAICAQTPQDAERITALGGRNVIVTGSVKFDVTPQPELIARGVAWRAQIGARPVLFCASTRDGEEALILDAIERINAPGLLTVIVPRHPQRFDEVAALIERRRLSCIRRSSGVALAAETRLVLGDSMGEMAVYYAACDIAFIGGTLLRFGGQNLIEACAMGKPVLLGPHTYNFAEAAEQAIAAGAAMRVRDVDELAAAATRLLTDSDERQRMSHNALAFSRAHEGATARVLNVLTAALVEAPNRDAT